MDFINEFGFDVIQGKSRGAHWSQTIMKAVIDTSIWGE